MFPFFSYVVFCFVLSFISSRNHCECLSNLSKNNSQISLSNSLFVNEENILMENIFNFSGYKSQYTLENVEEQLKRRKLCKSEIKEATLIKMFKITVFLVKKHWAHATKFEDTVRSIGEDHHGKILSEYVKLS